LNIEIFKISFTNKEKPIAPMIETEIINMFNAATICRGEVKPKVYVVIERRICISDG
jgi:hypothetical protein